jgi:Ser/Thr protein kinase RdoA (MazF antagonist)
MSADAAPDAAVPFDEITAGRALAGAAAHLGLDTSGARLLRLGENAVFHLPAHVVGRVSRSGQARKDVRRTVEVSRWLAREDIPAIRVLDGDLPVEVGGHLVTFWEALDDPDGYGSTVDLARLLRGLHALPPPADPRLPGLDPFARAAKRIRDAPLDREGDRDYLSDRLDQLRMAYAQLSFAEQPVVLHGDASVGNVILDRAGTPRLIDLDSFAVGPREWDLVLTALYYERYGWHTEEEYTAFCDEYGADVMTWPGYPVLADVRELLMVTWISQKAADSPELGDEVRRRIDDIRLNRSRRNWRPY